MQHMSDMHIVLPSKPKVVKEEGNTGVFEIDALNPGYGQTLGSSIRRIILSSLPGAAVTTVKIDGASHEFSTIDGIKEDVITVLLHLKLVRFKLTTDEPQVVSISVKGSNVVTAADIQVSGQVEILNPEQYICELTDKSAKLNAEIGVSRGLGFVSKEDLHKDKMDIGTIALDATFSPIRRVSYEVSDMRVGDRTNFNRLRISIETDGSISPREALISSIKTMISQLKSIAEIKEDDPEPVIVSSKDEEAEANEEGGEEMAETLKTRIDTLDISTRTLNALQASNIRTVGGIARKRKEDLLDIEGIGEKGIQEIKKALGNFGITLKE
jgi:DNA-directed RNA polymerase subunit alpha